MANKVLAIILILVGEMLTIYTELFMARTARELLNLREYWTVLIIISIGGALLLLGYRIGYNNFSNIWVVVGISLTSILIIEPILAFGMFNDHPTKGAVIGLILGTIGMLCTILPD
jgi:hypothetical protein